ncbi:MAG: TSUP family transporter [Bacteroidota bacterium]
MSINNKIAAIKETNKLFPVFLKLEQMRLLIIGGGRIGLEKLNTILYNSPATQIKLIAISISTEIRKLSEQYPGVQLIERPYQIQDLDEVDIVIIAINERSISELICADAKAKGKLINVADKPDLCDFYMGSIVKRGNLKIAISTNGKSPTIAKRLKEIFSEALPDEIDDLLDRMQTIKGKLNGNLSAKISKLNEITQVLVEDTGKGPLTSERHWKRIASYSLFAFFFMFVGHLVLSYIPFNDILGGLKEMTKDLDAGFYWMIGAGFLAQLVDGALGMGYGVMCTIVLLSTGVNLPAISGSIHTAEMFSSGVSGYSHYKFGNVNKKLFKTLLIPGVIGAIGGAYLLGTFGNTYAEYIRPALAAYTLFLGTKILLGAFRKNRNPKKVKRVGWLAGAGGFLDSFGGGGWGPLVTSTLISKGRSPRYVIGSVSITEFFVTLASALTFFTILGVSHWQVIVGLIIGGTVAAPLAAKLAGKLPLKTMFILVGILVIIWSMRILLKSLGIF